MVKPLIQQFEDELGMLVDRYLRQGISIEQLRDVLRSSEREDHYERRRELRDTN